MTVSPREARLSQHRISLAAVRSFFLLLLVAAFGASSFAQSLTIGAPVNFGDENLGQQAQQVISFTAPSSGVTIQSISVTTTGIPNRDFTLISAINPANGTSCIGQVLYSPGECNVTVAFSPQEIGLRLGAFTITDTANTVVNTVYLAGIGVGPQLVFAPSSSTAVSSANGLTFTAGTAIQDANGDTIFTDLANNRILEETTVGAFSVLVTGSSAGITLTNTSGLALDSMGSLYVSAGPGIYVLPSGGTTLTPLAIPSGIVLQQAAGLAFDTAGDLFIADTAANTVYELSYYPSESAQAVALTGQATSLNGPTGLAVDANSTLYIADTGNHRIVEVPITTRNSTILTLSIPLSDPIGVAVDAAGTVYIADAANKQIVEATTTGNQFVLTEASPTNGKSFSPIPLDLPTGVLIGPNGDIIVSDNTLGLVTVVRSTALVYFPTPTLVGTLDNTDDPLTLTVQDTGNDPSTLTAGTDPSLSGANPSAFQIATTGSCPSLTGGSPSGSDNFSLGEICTYTLNFDPAIVGLNPASIVLTTAAAGGLSSSSTASLNGIGLANVDHFSLVAVSVPATNPTTINKGGSVELILTALQANGQVATDYTGTVVFTTSDTANGVYLGGTTPGANTSTYTMIPADDGILTIPATAGLQLNSYGIYTATATADTTYTPTGTNGVAISNNIYVLEPDTFSLTSSVNPSLVNQTTQFTLTINTAGPNAPTGTVYFYSNGTPIGSAPVTDTGTIGTASINYSFAAAGSYPIKATYVSNDYVQDGSATLTQVVGNPTTLSLTSSINPSTVGQSTVLTATINALAAFGTPTGTMKFYDGATLLGTVPVDGYTANLTVSFSTVGTHTLTAVFTSTNVNLLGATSGPYLQYVINVSSLNLTSTINPSLPNQVTTLTATLTALGTSTGTVNFYDGATLIGSAPLSGTSASINVGFATTGNHPLKAVYTATSQTANATSNTLIQVVLYTTTATLTSSVNPVNVNGTTLLTATVKSTTGTPTGTVTFKSNGAIIGTGTLNGGVATLSTSFAAPGVYTLIAVYGGDANDQTSTTNTVLETVINVVNVSLSSSVNPVFLDNPTVLTATVTPVAPGTTPTGTVSFFDGGTPIGTAPVSGGVASLSASFVYAGNHTITATYSGDAADAPNTSPAYTQVVADFSLTVASGGSASGTTIAGRTATYSLVVTPIITSTFPAGITLTVSGLPSSVTGTLTPTTIAAGSGATPVSLTTTAAPLQTSRLQRPRMHHSPFGYAPAALALLALPLAWFRRRNRFASLLASICLLVGLTAGLSGCMSNAADGYYGQTPQTYNLTVTATSGNLSRSQYLTLTVQ